MKIPKILKVSEYSALCESKLKDIRVSGVVNENIAVSLCEPLFESEKNPATNQIEPAVIALPICDVTIESLTNTITKFLKSQQMKEDIGFTVGNFFSGDYQSGKCKWSEKSLCVSLTGAISNREGTIAAAVEIMSKLNLSIILVLNELGVMEITREGTSELRPKPQSHIKRIGE